MSAIIKQDAIFLNTEVPTGKKEEALAIISQKISTVSNLSVAELTAGFAVRESLSTTGFGAAFAIPHTKIKNEAGWVTFFRFSKPVEWDAIDGLPVTTAIALAMPEVDPDNIHLKMIAKLARLLMHDEFIDTLNSLTSEAEISTYLNTKLEV